MRLKCLIVLFATVATLSAQEPTRIVFGSCLVQSRSHPALSVAIERSPELFVFLGDNVYADSADPAAIRRAYERLAASPLFQELRATTRVVATWDDHDYGRNDAGRGFTAREASESIFEEFWDVSGPAAERPGVYRSVELGVGDRSVQVILLDTRYFRSPLERARPRPEGKGPYAAGDESGTLLGEAQWAWLERVLGRPSDLRIVASSIQVLAEHHGWESWANFPHERRRLLEMLARSGAPSVIVSGDRHFAEISGRSVRVDGRDFTFADVTSSGINRGYPAETPTANRYRAGGYHLGHNVGELRIDWPSDGAAPSVRARIYDAAGDVVIEQRLTTGRDR